MGKVRKRCGTCFASPYFVRATRPGTVPGHAMTLKIGRLFGINLFIHWTFWLLPLWIIFTHIADPATGPLGIHLSLLAALFGFVVLHEYGHALTARFFS